ncbi:Crp/Fnr family transcriptional regulator [Peptoniphilus sp. KCTC 25270]|uniref:Crp/Fnr family transcriptional regulator n=1 Tax=Peptoniphilus sp. KCTC 25270 TaxID=2897414 RepID=UPI001E4720B0|nr:Crp/Fnr family transcriptional regulator [Peptoniphilus sp. KCTC 25270]MCD1146537.1 Crp/Fnr family transcriptional regulator [Peptoniphilus sp. KCTC 25270]
MEMCKACKADGRCLSKVNLFKEIGVDESKSIYLSANQKDYEKGASIFFIGDFIDKIIIVRYGKIKTSIYDEDGRENIRKIYVEGDIIGEDSIFLDKYFESNAVAIEKTGICQIDKATLRSILVKDHNFSLNMIKALSKKVYETEKLLEILSIRDAYTRLAAFLAYRARIIKDDTINLNQETIGQTINMSRETVSRKLAQLEEDGYIENQAYKKIKIKNLPGLINLSIF